MVLSKSLCFQNLLPYELKFSRSTVLRAKLIEQGWALQPSLVNKSINLGTTNTQGIDQVLKVLSHDVIIPMHWLTSLKILAEL